MKTIFFSFSITNSSLTEYFVILCNKLTKDYRVLIITDRIVENPFQISPDVTILRWPSARPTTLKAFLFLIKLILKYRPVTMVSMFGSMNVFVVAGFLLRVKNRIAWNHSMYAKTVADSWRNRRKKRIYQLATHVFTNSRATRRDLIDYFDVPKDKVKVMYNAVREVPRRSAGYEANRIMFFGRFHPAKGLDILLAAMPEIVAKLPDTKLTLFGAKDDGPIAESYRKKAKDLQVLDHVEFGGNLLKQEVIEMLATANCCIVPSFLEAFGFVVIESFSVGTPVVGSDTSGISEVIRDGQDGLLFEPGNAAALAEKVIKMLADKDFRDRCAVNCLEHFRQNFELETVTDTLCADIRRLT
jgi:glycosyltransferase involved in cell wall biosynthesis